MTLNYLHKLFIQRKIFRAARAKTTEKQVLVARSSIFGVFGVEKSKERVRKKEGKSKAKAKNARKRGKNKEKKREHTHTSTRT